MVKARSGEVYWARFQWEGEQLIRLVEDQVGTIQSVGQSLQSPTLLFGDGWLAYEKEFQPYLEYPYETVPSDAMWPQAMSVGLASLEYFRTGRFNGTGLVPRYIQRSYAEMKREDHSRNHSKGLGLNGKP
jgi:tRNA A37 threonylcarbamoyladenosine modification protein TsaB